jgi:predicted transcriptional regulator
MTDKIEHRRTLSIRLPKRLDLDLRRVATRESNSTSAVARRLLAAGIARELRGELDAEQRERNDTNRPTA